MTPLDSWKSTPKGNEEEAIPEDLPTYHRGGFEAYIKLIDTIHASPR